MAQPGALNSSVTLGNLLSLSGLHLLVFPLVITVEPTTYKDQRVCSGYHTYIALFYSRKEVSPYPPLFILS